MQDFPEHRKSGNQEPPKKPAEYLQQDRSAMYDATLSSRPLRKLTPEHGRTDARQAAFRPESPFAPAKPPHSPIEDAPLPRPSAAPPKPTGFYETEKNEQTSPYTEHERGKMEILMPPPREQQQNRFFGIAAVMLLCVIVSSVVTFMITSHMLGNVEAQIGAQVEAYIEAMPPQTVSTTWTSEQNAALSAAEIYLIGRRQVVGITTEVINVNHFGQETRHHMTGTGFILTEDGYILTNYHVVERASRIAVTLEDGQSFEARFVGGESVTSDIAVLKIEATGLTPATIGTFADMSVGERMYTIGNPLGDLVFTISEGLVSALEREVVTAPGQTILMFQISAAVNAGNSGGPVYNAHGEVIGIVTAKSSLAHTEGIGFAIPIDEAIAYAAMFIQ